MYALIRSFEIHQWVVAPVSRGNYDPSRSKINSNSHNTVILKCRKGTEEWR
jgi:hypothetical protein